MVGRVDHGHRERVDENGRGLVETHAVFLEVRLCLTRIPFHSTHLEYTTL